MAFTHVGTDAKAGTTHVSHTNSSTNDILCVYVLSSGTPSVSGGGVTTWHQLGPTAVGSGTLAGYSAAIFWGQITSTGSQNVAGDASCVDIVAVEFNGGTGGVYGADGSGATANGTAHTLSYPSLTPAGSGELYFGFVVVDTGIPGTTINPSANFTAIATIGDCQVGYSLNAPSPSAPTASDSSTAGWMTSAGLIQYSTPASGAATAAAVTSVTTSGVAGFAAAAAAHASVTAGGSAITLASAAAAAQVSVIVDSRAYLASVSSDGTYLQDQFGKPFLISGDAGWAAPYALDATDQETYIADRASKGMNTIVACLVGNSTNELNADGKNLNGVSPWTDSDFTGSTFSHNETYWTGIDAFLQLCVKYGISVFADALDAYSLEDAVFNFGTITTGKVTAYAEFLANRYPASQYPNIVWFLGNDYNPQGTGEGVTHDFDSKYNEFTAGLANAGDTRLLTMELWYWESITHDYTTPTWASRVDFQIAYSYHPTYRINLRGRAVGAGPVVFFEGAYETDSTGIPDTDLDLRKQTLWSLTSGACGSFYGNDALWRFQTGWSGNLNTTATNQHTTDLAVFAGIEWWTLAPDTTSALVTAGRNTEYTADSPTTQTPATNDSTYGKYVTAACSSDGTLAVIYNPAGTTLTLSATPLASSPAITRVDPTSGATTSLSWTTTLTSPGNNAEGDPDWLYLITAGGVTTVTGTVTAAAATSVTAGGVVTVPGTAAASAQASVNAGTLVTQFAAATAAASASVTASGSALSASSALPAAQATVTAGGTVTVLAAATPTAQAAVTAAGVVTLLAAAVVAAQATVSATAGNATLGTANPTAQATVDTTGINTQLAASAPIAQASITAAGSSLAGSAVTATAQTTVTTQGLVTILAAVIAAAKASVTVAAHSTGSTTPGRITITERPGTTIASGERAGTTITVTDF